MEKFKNRQHAGQYLAAMLGDYQTQPDHIILALPRGGVPVAFEIATHLNLPLDILLVRKIGAPFQEELAIGAIAENDCCVFNQGLIEKLQISSATINDIIKKEQQELQRRGHFYRDDKALPKLDHKTVIIVDDGIATGATMKVAVTAVKKSHPKKIIIATPVASRDSIAELSEHCDQIVCPLSPEPFNSVGQWYDEFDQVSDKEVCEILEHYRR